nr:hypothetical protein HmN_000063800 [Hymenolepis microstoma]
MKVAAFQSVTDDNGILKKVIERGWIPVKPSERDQFIAEIHRTYEDGPKVGKVVESDEGKDPIWTIHFNDMENDSCGLKYALLSMELGEISEFILRPEYSGSSGALRYHIKLIDFRTYYEYPLQLQKIYFVPRSYSTLKPGQKVVICAKGYCNGQLYHEHKARVIVADADYTELPRAVVAHLNKVGSQGGWLKLADTKEISGKEREKFGFPPDGAVWYNVDVVSCLSDDTLSVEMADDFFRAGKSRLAEKIYEHCTTSFSDRCPEEALPRARLNAALASLQIGRPDKCYRHCLFYGQNAGENDKYHFRLGQACFLRYDFRKAEEHFREAYAISSDSNKKEILQAVHLSERKYKTKYDNILKTMIEYGPVVLLAQEI